MYGKLCCILAIAALLWGCSDGGNPKLYSENRTEEHIQFVQDHMKAIIVEVDGTDKIMTFEYALENKADASVDVYVEILFHDEKWIQLIGMDHLRVNGELSEPVTLEPSVWYKSGVSIAIPAAASLPDEEIEARLIESNAIEIRAVYAENESILASEYIRSLDYVQESL